MDRGKRKRIEAAGFRVVEVQDFLGLSDDEMQIVELRVALGRNVRRLREAQNLTQQQLAARFQSTQSRVAKIEAAAPDVSLDLMIRGFFAAGGKLHELTGTPPRRARPEAGSVVRKKVGTKAKAARAHGQASTKKRAPADRGG